MKASALRRLAAALLVAMLLLPGCLEAEPAEDGSEGVTEVTLLGGLVINRGNPDGRNRVEDYFKPITFQVS